MQLQGELHDLEFCPSFNCYISDSLTATTAARVSRELKQEQAAQFYEFSDVDEEDFGFSLELSDEEVTSKHINLEHRRFIFPVFDSALLAKGEVHLAVEDMDDASAVNFQLQKSSVNEQEDSSSSSSSEADEIDCKPSGIFCMWRPKADVVSSHLAKSKKSNSAGSGSHGSRRWKIQNLLRRSNSEGEESIFFLRSKKIVASKERRQVNSEEVATVAGKFKTTSSLSFHELLYVQKRAEQKGNKMKSFLPYKPDLLGFFVNINRIGNKKLPF